MWYLDDKNNWQKTDNSIFSRIEDFFQRIQTYKGEQDFDVENGIDYLSVFQGTANLEIELDTIRSQFLQYFKSIEINTPTYKGDTVSISITIVLYDNTVLQRNIAMRY